MQTYYVDEQRKAEFIKECKRTLIRKKIVAYIFALFFFSLPIIIPIILFIISPVPELIVFLFLEAFLIAIIAVPFGLVCYNSIFKNYIWDFRKRINESITLQKDYLEHTYEFKGERFTFTIEYNTILDIVKDTDFPIFKIDSPFFIRKTEYATKHFKGNTRNSSYINCKHELPFYLENIDTIKGCIECHCQENKRNNRTREEILIEKDVFTKEELFEMESEI